MDEVIDDDFEVWNERAELWYLAGALDEIAEPLRRGPSVFAVVHDDADDGRQALASRLAAQELGPGADEVLEHAKHHPVLGLALVLEEEPDVARHAAKARLKERVRESLVELLSDEIALHEFERARIDGLRERSGQDGGQLAGRILRHAKGALEELIVLGHRRAPYQSKRSTAGAKGG